MSLVDVAIRQGQYLAALLENPYKQDGRKPTDESRQRLGARGVVPSDILREGFLICSHATRYSNLVIHIPNTRSNWLKALFTGYENAVFCIDYD